MSQRDRCFGYAVAFIAAALLFAFAGLVRAQTKCVDGMAGEFACNNVDLLSHMPLNELGGLGSGADNWGWKDPQTGRYYAILARSSMTSFVDVSDPVNPEYLGKMNSTLGDSPPRDVKTYANHAFVVSGADDHGMQVFDLTRLRGVDSPQTFVPDVVYKDIGDAHNIAINEDTGYAYLVGGNGKGFCGGGLHVVDIRVPKSPVQAACYGALGDIHDTQCVIYRGPDPDYRGAEICFASNNPNLSIIEVSDKNNISLVGQASWPQQAFAHQGWLSEDQRYFLMGDEADEQKFDLHTRTIILDVSDLENPEYVGSHLADTVSVDHNQYVKGNFLYQANYSVGMRILHIDDLAKAQLTEVAWFDTFPEDDSVGGLGAWNVYPFFDNGTLLVSDFRTGLFMLRASVGNEFRINAGHAGAWFNPDTSGQGQLIDVEAKEQFMFVSWFTFSDASSDNPHEQHWFTAQGNYTGNKAELILYETLGGRFDDPQEVSTDPVGTATISFTDCGQGQMTYGFDEGEGQGSFPLHRLIPGSDNVCKELSGGLANATEAVSINPGMDGAWADADTLGQGFFIDAHTNPEGGNFIFVAWFTYGDDTASGQRWLTAQGDFAGSTAEIDLHETTGGSFDDPQPVSTDKVGTMTIDFTDCSNALLTYSLPEDGVDGNMAISRLIPGGQALCEELADQ